MTPLVGLLRQLRWFLMANHALAVFSRALLVSLLIVCAAALGFKITLGEIPAWFLALGVAIPLLIALLSLSRFTLPYAAARLDRLLRLDERLTTSLEVFDRVSPLAQAQIRDAERELNNSDLARVRRIHAPKELYFAGACALVLAATLFAPMPVESQPGADVDPRDQAALARAETGVRGVNDEGLIDIRRLKQEILAEIQKAKRDSDRLKDVVEKMKEAVDQARENLGRGGLSDKEKKAWEELQDAIDSAGGAVSARIPGKAAERLFHPSKTTIEKILKASGEAAPAGRAGDAPAAFHAVADEIPKGMTLEAYAEQVRKVYQSARWDPAYAPVVDEFFGGRR